VTVAQVPEVAKVRSLTKLCSLIFSGDVCCPESAVNPSAILSGTVAMHPGLLLVVRLTFQESVPPHSSSLSAAAGEETTQPTNGAV
jgi:hypothetical protein